MEEMLELAVVIIAAAIGIASKANKKKKKAQKPVKPATSAWDEMEESIEKRFDEFIEKHDGEPIIPYAPSQPAAAPQPAQAVQPVPQVIIAQTVPELHVEGAPAEPVAPPVKKPRPRPRPKAEEPVQTVHHTQRSPIIPERINAGTLRSAVVMSEVLGKPVSLRNTARQ